MASPLPRINENNNATVEAIDVTNRRIESVIESIDNMSVRLNIKLGSMASMMSDFFAVQSRTEPNSDGVALYGINVKLGSIAMMLSDFFADQRARWVRDDLLRDNQPGPRNPSPERDRPNNRSGFDINGAREQAQSWFGKILTGLGIAFLASKFDFSEAIQESGIFVYLTKGLTKIMLIGSGIAKMFDSFTSNPVIAKITKFGAATIGIINRLGTAIIPFYDTFLRLGKGFSKFLPIVAVVTTIIDFMRGFNGAETMVEGIKEGIAEVAGGWIGWPLEILKDIIGWVAGKFGFDNVKEWLDGFDFVEPVKNLARSIFDTLIRTFTFDEGTFESFAGIKDKLFDIVTLPINVAVNAIKDVFNIGDPEIPFVFNDFLVGLANGIGDWIAGLFSFGSAEEMNEKAEKAVSDAFWGTYDTVTNFFSNLLKGLSDMIPSVDDIIAKFKSKLPDWITGEDNVDFSTRINEIEKQIAEQTDALKRSKAGENVYYGPESAGQNRAVISIAEAKRLRDELLKEQARAQKQTASGGTTVNVVRGGDSTTNASSYSVNNFSGAPSSNRPD